MQEYRIKLPAFVSGLTLDDGDGGRRPVPDGAGDRGSLGRVLGREKLLKDRIRVLETELQRTREESFQAGYEEGRRRGNQDAQKELASLQSVIRDFDRQFTEAFEKIEGPLLELAARMAERIIGIAIERDDEARSILQEALRRMFYELVDQNRMIVEVHPGHLEWLETPDGQESLSIPRGMDVTFIGNPGLKSGECRVKTDDFIVDGTIAAQLDHLLEQLNNEDREWTSS